MIAKAVVPAFNEAKTIGDTVRALRSLSVLHSILVVDDGSSDQTSARARAAGAKVIRLECNSGKGRALAKGISESSADVILMVDGDLGETAYAAGALLGPVLSGEADMAVGVIPSRPGTGGKGLVRSLARLGLGMAGASGVSAPLSGQRALTRRAWETMMGRGDGFAVDLALTMAVHRAGLRYTEVPIDVRHRFTGRDLAGYIHRGRQFWHITRFLLGEIGRRREEVGR